MPYDRTQLITQARQLLNGLSDTFWTDPELADWIDQATIDISTKARCVEAIATVSLSPGLQWTPVPTGAIGIEAVLDQDGRSLTAQRLRQFGHVTDGDDTRPSSYAHYAGRLWFYGVPGEQFTFTVLYWVTTNQVDQLPDGYEMLVLLYVLMKARLKEEKYAAAAQLYAIYIQELQFQRQDLQDRQPASKEQLAFADRIISNG